MSKTVDERVVSMKFDNQHFEQGIRQTSNSLENFKKKFNFGDQRNEFDRLQSLVNTFSLTHMAHELSDIGDRFGLFGTIAGRVLENITDKAMSTIHNLVNQLGIGFGGIRDGFTEYELQINSVQTMLANMSKESDNAATAMAGAAGKISSSLQEMATQVVRGDWGNGQDRLEALGKYYQQIQDAVNMAWDAGGKVGSGWEKGLATISGSIDVAEEAAEAINGIGDASMSAEEKNRKNLDRIEKQLNVLNEYADKTVYTFSDMTSAIGQFMTAGVGLETSTTAIRGLANIGAAFGVNNENLKRTYYQLSQAINSGVVKLIDWRSVINANMAGPLFRDEIIKTAEEMGTLGGETLQKVLTDFNGSLQEGWLTSDVLTSAIAKFTESGLAEYFERTTGVAKEYGEELLLAYTEAQDATEAQAALTKAVDEFAKSGQKSREEIQGYVEGLKNVTDAATKVKTFSQLISVIREGIGTGWADTFKILIGDFYEAEDLLTGINKKVGGFISNIAKARNQMLTEWKEAGGRDMLLDALGTVFDFTSDKSILYNLFKPIKDAFMEIFNLEGFDSSGLLSLTEKFKSIVENIAKFLKDHYEEIKGIAKLIFAYLKIRFNMFMTKVKIVLFLLKLFSPILKVIFELVGKVAGVFGNFLGNSGGLVGALSSLTGSFNGLSDAISNINLGGISNIGDAISNLVPGVSKLTEGGASLGGVLGSFFGGTKEAEAAIDSAEGTIEDAQDVIVQAEDVKSAAKEIASDIGDDSASVVEGTVDAVTISDNEEANTKKSFNKSKKSLAEADGVISAARGIADKVSKVKESVNAEGSKTAMSLVSDVTKTVVKEAPTAAGNIKKAVTQSELIQQSLTKVGEVFSKIGAALKNFFYIDAEEIKKRFGIDIKAKGAFWDIIGSIYNWLKDHTSEIIGLAKLILAYKAVNGIVGMVQGFASVCSSIGYAIGQFGAMFHNIGVAFKKMANAMMIKAIGNMMLEMATSIGILVAAVAALTAIPVEQLWPAIGALATIVGIFVALTFAATKMNAIDTAKIVSIAAFLITFGIAIGILVASIKSLGKMQPEQITAGVIGVVSMIASLIAAVNFMKMSDTQHIAKVAGVLIALSVAILLLSVAIKSFAKMDPEIFYSGLIRVAEGLLVLCAAMKSIQSSAKENAKSAGTLIALAISLLLLGAAIKKFAKMEPEVFYRGLVRVAAGLFVLGAAINFMMGTDSGGAKVLDKGQKLFNPIVKTLLAMAAAMIVLALVLKLIADIPAEKAWPAFAMLSGMMIELGLLAKEMMKSAKYMNSGKGVATTLIGFSAALLILSLIVKILGSMPLEQAIQGTIMLSALMGEMAFCFVQMAKATKTAGDNLKKISGVLIAMVVVIAVLAIVVNSLASMDFVKGIAAVGEIGILMGGLAALMWSISEVAKVSDTKKIRKVVGWLLVIEILVGALSLLIGWVSTFANASAIIQLATAVDMILGAMAGMLFTVAEVTKIKIDETKIKGTVGVLYALTGVVAAVALVIAAFSNITKAETVIPLATAASELMVAIIPLLLVVAEINKTGVTNGMIKTSLVILGSAALLIDGFVAIIATLGGLFNLIDEHFNNAATEGLIKGITVLVTVAEGIGQAIGAFIAAISEGMLIAAKNIAEGLKAVFDQIINLVDSLHGKVDDNSVELVKTVIKLIAVMTASDLIDALTTWFTTKILGQEKSNIADRLSSLAEGMKALNEQTAGLDVNRMQQVAGIFDNMTGVIAALSALVMSEAYDSLVTWFIGGRKEKDAVAKLADGMKDFVENGFVAVIKSLDNDELTDEKVESLRKRLEVLGTFVNILKPVQDLMPRTDSLVSVIVGKVDGDWGALGTNLSSFMSAMGSACLALTSDVVVNDDGSYKAPNAAKYEEAKKRVEVIGEFVQPLSQFNEIRDNAVGSLKGFIFGDKMPWGEFGTNLKQFVSAMHTAVTTLTEDVIGNESGEVIKRPDDAKFTVAGERLKTIAKFSETLKEFQSLMPGTAIEIISPLLGVFKSDPTTWAELGTDLKDFIISLCSIVATLNDSESYTVSDEQIALAVTRMGNIGKLSWPLSKFKDLIVPARDIWQEIGRALAGTKGTWDEFGEDLKGFTKSLLEVCKTIGSNEAWGDVNPEEILRSVEGRVEALGKLGDALTKFTSFVYTLTEQEGKGSIITLREAADGSSRQEYVSVIQQLVTDVPLLVQSLIELCKTVNENAELIDASATEGTGASARLEQLTALATPIANFIQAFINLDSSDSETAGENIKGILGAFTEMTNDTTSLEAFGESLASFVQEAVVIGKMLALDQTENTVLRAVNLSKELSQIKFGESFKDLDVFNTAIYDLGRALKAFGEYLSDDNFKTAMSNGVFQNLNAFISNMSDALKDGVPEFKTTGESFGEELINGFKNSGENGNNLNTSLRLVIHDAVRNISENWREIFVAMFKDLGKKFAEGLAEGMRSSEAIQKVKDAAENLARIAKEATEKAAEIKSPSRVMMKLGKYIPLGFAKGIGDHSSIDAVKKSATAMAQAVAESTMKFLEIHSPSKVMENLGQYTIQGFINGIQNGLPKVQEIAKMLSESISKIPSTIDGEDFANKVLGNVSQVAVASITKSLIDASDGTMSFEEATQNATNSIFKFAAALYAESDACQQAKEDLATLEKERDEAYKARSEAREREAREIAAAEDYKNARTTEALSKIEDTDTRSKIKDLLDRIYTIKEQLKDPELRDMQKVLIEDYLKATEKELDATLEAIDDTKEEGEQSARDIAKAAVDSSKECIDAANEVVDNVKENAKTAEEAAEEADKAIAQKNEELVKEILKQWTEFRNKIRDNVKSFLSIFSGNALKIDLFSETESAEDKYLEERKSKLEEITAAEEELKQAEEDLLAAQEELAAAQQRSDNVEGRSLIALNDIEEATDRVTEAEQRRLEAQEKLSELNDNLETFDYENSGEGIGTKMLETMEKNVSAYQTYQQQLKSLYDFGINKSYLDELKANGMSSAEQVAKLFAAASSEAMGKEFTEKFNQNIQRQEKIEQESYKQSLVDKIERAKQWSKDIAELEDAGLDKNLIKEISEQGPDNSQLLDLVKNDIEKNGETAVQEWNQLYKDLEITSESVADAITSALSAESGFAKWITAAILQAAGGNAALDVRGDILQRLLENDEGMRNLWAETFKANINKWEELTDAEKEANYSREGYASKLAADAVNLAINKINKETNGAYAIQNGLIASLTETVPKSLETGVKEYTEAATKLNTQAVGEAVTKTAETVSTVTGEIVEGSIDSVTDNQIATVEAISKVVTEDSEMNRRMETVKSAILNAISEHIRYMRNGFSQIYVLLNTINSSTMSQGNRIIAEITNAASRVATAVSQIQITNVTNNYSSGSSSGGSSSGGYENEPPLPTSQDTTVEVEYGPVGNKKLASSAKKAGTAVGTAYGEGVATGAKKALGINSPSKVFMAIGKFVDLGFAQGIKDNTPKVASALEALTHIDTKNVNSLLDFSGIQNGNLLDLRTTRSLARGINPNSAVSMERMMRDFMANQSAASTNNDNSTTTNTFNITSNNPKEVAYEVDRILQKRAEQRRGAWA